jgi:hypothetical protein
LGSTPYQVDSYENLMNDYEEEWWKNLLIKQIL